MTPQNISYTANGTCTAFPYGFPVFEDMELEVLVDGVLQTSGYTLVGDGANTGGAVVFTAAPASGKTIVLRRAGKVQVSGSDAPGFLADKLVAGANVTVTQVEGALEIAATANPADFLRKDQNLADLTDPAAARTHLGLGSAAVLDAGTAAHQVVQLDASARLPAVDASQLTNLPHPTATSLGGVEAFAPQSHKFLTGIGTDGVPTAAQPAASDVSGLASVATSGAYGDLSGRPSLGTAAALDVGTGANQVVQLDASAHLPAVDGSALTNLNASALSTGTVPAARLPAPTAASLGGVEAFAPQTHKFLTGIGTDGVPLAAQPAASDVTGLASVATSGAYGDLSGRPTLGTAAALDVDTDGTLAANSDARIASQKAVKTYVNNLPARANSFTAKQTFTKSVETAKGASVASAATTDIWANADGNLVHVTGTTTITSFGTAPQPGAQRAVVFDGALTLTNGANLILPGGANITTAAGDIALVFAETTTQFRVHYTRASGSSVVSTGSEIVVPVTQITSADTIELTGFAAGYDYTLAVENMGLQFVTTAAAGVMTFYFQINGGWYAANGIQYAQSGDVMAAGPQAAVILPFSRYRDGYTGCKVTVDNAAAAVPDYQRMDQVHFRWRGSYVGGNLDGAFLDTASYPGLSSASNNPTGIRMVFSGTTESVIGRYSLIRTKRPV